MGDPTTCFYQFIYDEKESVDTQIIQYFIMNGLVLCIKLNIYISCMLYAWSLCRKSEVLIDIKKNKYFLSFNTRTTVFSWGAVNSDKN